MLDIIFFAIIAAFIISRLFKILGDTQYEKEDRPQNQDVETSIFRGFGVENEDDLRKEIIQQIDMMSALEASLPEDQRKVFEQLRESDVTFTADKFVEGAKAAFEMIVKALSDGDKETLSRLLDPEVYEDFAKEIDRRTEANQKHEVTIVAMKSCDITDADIEKGKANIAVKIVSEQINLVKAISDGVLLGGNPSKINIVTDVWMFSKPFNSKNKMWQLVSTDVA